MSNKVSTHITSPPWWLWIILVHILFITTTGLKVFHKVPKWLKPGDSALNLLAEHNYAVWWSGFCLMLAGILFYYLASQVHNVGKDRFMWLVLAAVTLGLSADEVASVHERVSQFGGWWALLPFAILGTLAFGYAIIRMILDQARRVSALLICTSLIIFFAVAGLEHLEHTADFSFYVAKSRLIVEEGAELIAGFLLILAAILQVRKSTGVAISQMTTIVAPGSLIWIKQVLFFGLILHLLVCIFWVPVIWVPAGAPGHERGNPAYWYPMFVFVLAAFHCACQARTTPILRSQVFWVVGVLMFLGLSTGQMINHGYFISVYTEILPKELHIAFYARASWTVLPPLLFILFLKPGLGSVNYLFLTLFLIYLLHPGRAYFEAYYILSGFAAYLLIFLLLNTTRSGDRNELYKQKL
ncbi:hypothetical protein ACFL17_08525 [Pseudomonadota bacterium]